MAATFIIVLAIAAVMMGLAMWSDRLTLFAPSHTRGLKGPAQVFCLDHCRNPDDSCPHHLEPTACPLWQFVDHDLQVNLPANPLREVRGVNLVTN